MPQADYYINHDRSVTCTCKGCGTRYNPDERNWNNWFYCSTGCCAVRRAELNPEPEEDVYY